MSTWQSIFEIAEKVQSGQESAVKLVEKSLSLINDNKKYCAIITTAQERAMERAKTIDQING